MLVEIRGLTLKPDPEADGAPPSRSGSTARTRAAPPEIRGDPIGCGQIVVSHFLRLLPGRPCFR